MPTLEQRFDALERSNRRLRCVAATLALALVGVAGSGMMQPAQPADVVKARSFEVVAPNGKTLVRLHAGEIGNGAVTTYNAEGKMLVELQATLENQGYVRTYNKGGGPLVWLGATQGGSGAVKTYNAREKEIVQLTADQRGRGVVVVDDPGGNRLKRIISTRQPAG